MTKKFTIYAKDSQPTLANRNPEPIFVTDYADLANVYMAGYGLSRCVNYVDIGANINTMGD